MRLRRTDSSGRGYTRVRSGTGFSYRDARGDTVTDAELRSRFDALGIPPAWRDVWIAPYPNGHIQATGTDAAGRRQYIYHPTWREQKDRIKFDRSLRLAESLPGARRAVTLALRSDGPSRERALAAAFRMLDTGSLRIGSERYAKEHGSIGLSTLLCAHATTHGDRVALAFPGKSHQAWTSEILDADLAAVIRSLKRRGPNARLLAFRDGREWHPLAATDINVYVRERAGDDFTAKDFRTLHGTIAAGVSLAGTGVQPTVRARNAAISQAMRDASAVLGNTPAIARASYVDPRLLDHYRAGDLIDPARPETTLRTLLFD
ncbi:DNA topoisomerase IB [Microbacteriaceae bacterium VKM Ac-2854]|nr:DNA topoisomerase IB [Microbacteriaceae bacterium VKM Ac-2854]